MFVDDCSARGLLLRRGCDPSFASAGCFLPVRSTILSLLLLLLFLLLSAPGSSHTVTLSSSYGWSRSQTTLSDPLPSCTCPQTASLGLTLQRLCRRASHPAGRVSSVRSQCIRGGVCVTTMSVSSGMSPHGGGDDVGSGKSSLGVEDVSGLS